MFRAQPIVNKLLNKKWEEKEQLLHESRLRLAKSTLDSRTPPSKFRHLKLNHKKGQQQEGIYTFMNLSVSIFFKSIHTYSLIILFLMAYNYRQIH